jgi:tricorn protease
MIIGTLMLYVFFGATTVAQAPLLPQQPTINATDIVFAYADDLWSVPRAGGDARRLTDGPGGEAFPAFSPDGEWLAFTGQYEGNPDVYLMPAIGGNPRRLTWHPGADTVVGWTPDGKHVLFRSNRESGAGREARLFTIAIEGGMPAALPLPMGYQGSYSPDGRRIAYVPLNGAFQTWKRYRGGTASPVWIADLADSRVEPLPRKDWNDFNPMWVGDAIYFLSDRTGPVNLYAFDTRNRQVREVARGDGFDIKSAAAGNGAIVYEQFGSLHLLDLSSGKSRPVPIRLVGDMPGVRPRYAPVGDRIASAGLSPTGKRAVFEARGEVLTVPAEKGDVRNLTRSSGSSDRDPVWSPDGKWIACLSDADGEYALYLVDQSGAGEPRRFALADAPSFYYNPVWAPDNRKIAYTDKRLNLWYVDLDSGRNVKVASDTYDKPERTIDPAWSPDSRWIAYTRQLANHMRAVCVFSVETGTAHQLTDGLSDARFAAFDRDGKYLFFTASTDIGPTTAWLDLSSYNRPVSRSVYAIVLQRDAPSPLAPESDEETVKDEAGKASPKTDDKPTGADAGAPTGAGTENETAEKAKDKPADVRIDFEFLDQRILALPLPASNYTGLWTGKAGQVYLREDDLLPQFGPPSQKIQLYDLKKRKTESIADGVGTFVVSHNGEKMLLQLGSRWAIAPAGQPFKPGDGWLPTEKLEVRFDPKAEWRQMYREVWRIERDFLYDPNAHGLDLRAAEKRYEPYLDAVASRGDLNYLFSEMLGNLVLGHTYVGGGDLPQVRPVSGGLMGADYEIADGRYRFARIYRGENWNPGLKAPLTQPGVDVREGEYLLEVDGCEVRAGDNVHRFFENTAGKAVRIKVGSKPDGTDAREVVVEPLPSETMLRHRAWLDGNRRRVDELSGGRIGYVYLPDTAAGGYTYFNRYFFAQVGKQALVVDERYNGGGYAADYIVDLLGRPLMNFWATREGEFFTTPTGAIFGPKAMLINEFAGSGGDAMPWYFRRAKVGPLVGKRTWGGLVGIYDYPALIDGGYVTAPRVAFWNPEGQWDVENYGTAPDVEVELDPFLWRQGRDAQLEKAVEILLKDLERNPPPSHQRPAFPNYYN